MALRNAINQTCSDATQRLNTQARASLTLGTPLTGYVLFQFSTSKEYHNSFSAMTLLDG